MENFANDSLGIVTTGGTDAPVSGTPETWVVNVTNAFPLASTVTPPPASYFYVADPNAETEKIQVVKAGTATGAGTWSVIRGADSTTPLTHTTGFTIVAVAARASWRSAVAPSVISVQDYGATGNGTTDDTTAIQDALNAVTWNGQVVYLPPGQYLVSQPLVMPNYSMILEGDVGATQGGAGLPGVGSILYPSGSFTSNINAGAGNSLCAVIIAGTGSTSRQGVRDLWIDGANFWSGGSLIAGAASCDGINFPGQGGGISLERIGVYEMPGWGIYVQNQGTYSGTPLGLYADTIICQQCGQSPLSTEEQSGGGGGYYCGATDTYHHNVHGQENAGVQIYINSGDARLDGCRADGDAESTGNTLSTYGFVLKAFNGGSNLGFGVSMVNCATEGNNYDGCLCTGAGNADTYGAYQLVGCQFTGDGYNNGTPSTGYAGVAAASRVIVSLTDVNVTCGGTGQWPYYALRTAASGTVVPDAVRAIGGFWQAASAFVNDAAPATLLDIDQSVEGFIGSTSGTSGTTAMTRVATVTSTSQRDALPENTWFPSDSFITAWTFDPACLAVGEGLNPGSGTLEGQAIQIRQQVTISEFFCYIEAAGSALTTNHCYGVIYNSAGTLLGYTADQSSNWTSTGLNGSAGSAVSLTAAFSGALTLSPGKYWLGAYYGGSACTFLRSLSGIGPALSNIGQTGSAARSAQLSASAGTTPPGTVTFTTPGSGPLWLAVT